MSEAFAIQVQDLTYNYPYSNIPSLHNITINIPWNSKTLLVGNNGAGKSTLLKLLGGKTLCLNGKIKVNGIDPFTPSHQNSHITYLGTEWCHMNILNRDISVLELLQSIGLEYYYERGMYLIEILKVDLSWRMHRLSDGQKRRVQLCMGLLKPFKILLLDEVTVDLDIVTRSRLLSFLDMETTNNSCSIIYATHIFDGLSKWPDQVVHICNGRISSQLNYKEDISFNEKDEGIVTADDKNKVLIGYVKSLYPLALSWLLEDDNR